MRRGTTVSGLAAAALAAAVLTVGVAGQASGLAAQPAATRCGNPTTQPRNRGTGANALTGVAVISGCKAWAVGQYMKGTGLQTLVEFWNGRAWRVQNSPNPGGSTRSNRLYGVTAISSTNAWAVGAYHTGTASQTLILHWNGKRWKVQPSPNPGGSRNVLLAVTATSSTNAWAVGYQGTSAP